MNKKLLASLLLVAIPLASHAGNFSTQAWTGDEDLSFLAPALNFTHKISFNADTAPSINGVAFDGSGADVRSGANWSLDGAIHAFTGNNATPGAGGTFAPGSFSATVTDNFYFGTDGEGGLGGKSTLTLTGLDAGQAYRLMFFNTSFGGVGGRVQDLTVSDDTVLTQIDQNEFGDKNGQIVFYDYMAPANGELVVEFAEVVDNASWHHYAFANAETPIPEPSAYALLFGLFALLLARRKRNQ